MRARFFLAALATLCPVVAQLNKPVLQPPLDLDGSMESQLRSTLPKHSFQISQWTSGYLPEACKTEAQSQKFKPADLVVFNVTYNDCVVPFVVCRHKSAPVTLNDLLTVPISRLHRSSY